MVTGKLTGLYPDNTVLAALVDEILDSVEEFACSMMGELMGKAKEEEKKAAADELCKEGGTVRYWMDKFLNRIQETEKRGIKSGLFVGEELTIADLKFSATLKHLMQRVPQFGKDGVMGLDKYKPLLKVVEIVDGNEKIKAFEEQLQKNIATFKEKPENNVYKYAGKSVTGSL